MRYVLAKYPNEFRIIEASGSNPICDTRQNKENEGLVTKLPLRSKMAKLGGLKTEVLKESAATDA